MVHWVTATDAWRSRPRVARATLTIVVSRMGAIPPSTRIQISRRRAGSRRLSDGVLVTTTSSTIRYARFLVQSVAY